MSPFRERKPLVVISFRGERRSLAAAVWPDLREGLIAWHLDGKAELRRGSEIVDPFGLKAVDELLELELAVFDPVVAKAAAAHYLQG